MALLPAEFYSTTAVDDFTVANVCTWPEPHATWATADYQYPAARGQKPETPTGWQCPGCGRCWAPQVLACHICPESKGPSFIAKAADDDEDVEWHEMRA
jgi:hypothetical protein